MQCTCAVLNLWPARLYNIFPNYLIHGTIFGVGGGVGEKVLNIKYVFRFYLQLLPETSLILRRN